MLQGVIKKKKKKKKHIHYTLLKCRGPNPLWPGRGPRQTGAVLSGGRPARRPGLPGREGKPSRPLRPNGGEVALPDAERFQQEHGIRERYTKSRVPAPRLPRLGYIGSGTGILRWAIIFFLKSYMQNSAFCIAAV